MVFGKYWDGRSFPTKELPHHQQDKDVMWNQEAPNFTGTDETCT